MNDSRNNMHRENDGGVLIVDDVSENVRLLSILLESAGYRVRGTTSGKNALKVCTKEQPELILLDIRMPGMDGFEVCRQLKMEEQTQDIPVIFISALGSSEDKDAGFDAGAVDYITKPFRSNEVLARVGVHYQNQLLQRKLVHLATIDPLTGLFNRRAFTERLQEQIRIAQRYDTPCSLIMFDLDHFKHINDTHGHDVGDQVLEKVASLVKQQLRESDYAARWGGEEFVVLCPNTSMQEAALLGERLRETIADNPIEPTGTITASFGVAVSSTGDTPQRLLARADEQLYRAKREGRNCVRIADAGSEPT
ncbi:MAG: diguanylate cyclase [Sedimenticola sp.]